MSFEVKTDRPFGAIAPGLTFNLDSAAAVDVDISIELHSAMAKRWARKVERMTGMRVSAKDGRGYKGGPFSREVLAKRVTASGNIGGKPGWQDDPKNVGAEKEVGGEHWYNNREEMGRFAESIGIDLDKAEKVLTARGARLLYPRDEDPALVFDENGVAVGKRATAMANADFPDGLAIDYLADFQFQISGAGRLESRLNQVDIPAGKATYQVPLMGYGQMYKASPTTTIAYNVPDGVVEPTISKTVWTPYKLMMSMWATSEFDEDIIAPWLPAMEKAAMLGRAIALDHLILRGHTATGAGLNINAFGGALALGALDPRLCANGFFGANWEGTLGGGGAALAFKGVNHGGLSANLNLIPALRAALNKYGIDSKNLILVGATSARTGFVQDAKARPDTYSLLLEKRGDTLYLDGIEFIQLADSLITHANTGGLPTQALFNLEGMPVNLQPDGTYTGVDGGHTALALVNVMNWLKANKRRWNWQAVRLPLGEQVAVVGTERHDIKPIHPSVSEAIAFGVAR